MNRGDILIIYTPGGGGYGSPPAEDNKMEIDISTSNNTDSIGSGSSSSINGNSTVYKGRRGLNTSSFIKRKREVKEEEKKEKGITISEDMISVIVPVRSSGSLLQYSLNQESV